jgi:serine/threonine-protein kinase
MTRPLVGTSFAGYRVERVLGRGGMSVVYLAEHPRLKSRVALKVLAPALAEDDLFRERLLSESRLAASLSHPNVIPVYDTGEEEGVLFISMRFVDGQDLRTRLKSGRLPLADVASIIQQAAAALDAAHARGLVHRDVKPANILIEPGAAPAGHVYVADFGLSKHADAQSGATASGLVGTVDYMAPEQIEGRQLDGRADVYALGCVLFECLTGKPPFTRENDVAVLWAHIREAPPAPSELDRNLPRAFDGIVARALAKDPRDRYATCGELAEEVRAASATKQQRIVLPRPRWRRPRSRGLRRATAGVVAGLVVGAGVASAIVLAADHGAASPRVVTSRSLRPAASLQIPGELRRSCTRVAPPTPDFDQSALCHPRDVTSVQYSHALSGTRMRAQGQRAAYAHGAATPGARVGARGLCEDQTTAAVRDWGVTADGKRSELTPLVSPVAIRGRLLCYTSPNGWSAIEWTDKDYDVYSIAYGKSRSALYRWWRVRGGPAD